MTREVYSRRLMSRVVACISFAVFGAMLVSFLRDHPSHLKAASGSTLFYDVVGGASIVACLLVTLYAGFRVFNPTIVEGSLTQMDGRFVLRERNDLVICVNGKKYKFPLDSKIDTSLPSETVQVHMEVGAFHRPFYLEVR
jgi:hypothetical protein